MTDINTAKAQARQARKQLEEQRKQIQEGEFKAQKQLELLNKAQSKVPVNISARALRQNMGGLQGRSQRRQIEKTKKNISSQKQGVKNYLGKLSDYTGKLNTYENTQLKPFEASIANYEDEQSAMKSAQRFYDANVPWAFVEGKAQKYLKRLYKFHNLQKAAFTKQIDTFVTANPTEKLDIDWKNLRIKGVQSGALNKNFADLKSYNSAIKDFNKKLKTPKVNTTITSPTVLPPTISKNLPPVTSNNLTAKTNNGAIFKLASAQSLNNSNVLKNNGVGVSTGVSNRNNNWVANIPLIGNFLSDTFAGGNQGFQDQKIQATRAVVSAASPTDALKGEQFRPQASWTTLKTGTIAPGESPFKTTSLRQLREEAVFSGQHKPELFQQDLRTPTEKAVSYIPIVGQIKPTIEAARTLSREYSTLTGAESSLGIGNVDTSRFNKALGNTALQTGLLAGDIYFGTSAIKSGIKVGSEYLARRALAKTEPEISLGLSKGEGGVQKYVVLAKRESGKLKSYTMSGFNINPITGEVAQVEKGKTAQVILKNNKPISQIGATFSGETEKVPTIFYKEGMGKQIKEPTKGFFGNLNLLTSEENPKLIKSFGIGLGKNKGEYTKLLSGEVKKALKKKTGEITLINLDTGKSSIVDILGTPKARLNVKNINSFGVIRDLSKKESSSIVDIGGRLTKVTQTSKKVGGSVGVQIESKLLSSTKTNTFQNILDKTIPSVGATSIQKQKVETQSNFITQPKVLTIEKQEVKVEPSVLSISNKSQVGISKSKQELKNLEKSKQDKVITSKTGFKTGTVNKEVSSLRKRTKQKQAQEQIQKQNQITNTTTTTPTKPIIPKFLFNFLKSSKSKKESPLTYGDFEVYGRRFGKFKRIGIAKSKAEAKQLAKKFSLGGLGASTFIKKEGKKVPFNLGVGFRPSKVDSSIQVQNQRGGSGRLTTLGERREIKLLRKKRKLGVF